MPADSIDTIITDPPYGIDYHATRRKNRERLLKHIANDKAPYIWWPHDASRSIAEKARPESLLLAQVQGRSVSTRL